MTENFRQKNTVHHRVFSSQQQAEVVDHCKLQQQSISLHIVQPEHAGVDYDSFQPEQKFSRQLLAQLIIIRRIAHTMYVDAVH